jgi:hypothetical protein
VGVAMFSLHFRLNLVSLGSVLATPARGVLALRKQSYCVLSTHVKQILAKHAQLCYLRPHEGRNRAGIPRTDRQSWWTWACSQTLQETASRIRPPRRPGPLGQTEEKEGMTPTATISVIPVIRLPQRIATWILFGNRETASERRKAPVRRLPYRGIQISGQLLKRLQRYSDSHHTRKLVPSEVSEVGTASFAPELLTMVISWTLLPKALIGPLVTLSIAVLVSPSPV